MNFFEKFTAEAQHSLRLAQEHARALGHNSVGTEHLLLGIMAVTDSDAAKAIGDSMVNSRQVVEEIEGLLGKGDYTFDDSFDFTKRAKSIIEQSIVEAKSLDQNTVNCSHILLAIVHDKDNLAVRILASLRVDIDLLEQHLLEADTEKSSKDEKKKSTTPVIDKYGKDLTKLAMDQELDPVIGREKEIERIVAILSRRTKNNPVLLGEPGVGKSAVVEGLAIAIVDGTIPNILAGKRVVCLDMPGMVAGTKYRGEFEERVKTAIDEIKASKNIILFIDELHTIIGAGATEGSMDAANILKPALARAEIQVIGATTQDEFTKHIEKDAALERRFQPVVVNEPTKEETFSILQGLKERYEQHHKLKISDEAIHAAIELSDRYITDRYLPDKAIDLIDEASSRVRIKYIASPIGMKDLESQAVLIKNRKDLAVRNQDFERAASFRDDEKQLKDKMQDLRKQWEESMERATVTKEDIASVVSMWTSVPVTRLTQDQSKRLLKLESVIHERVVGQDEAIVAMAKAIRRSSAGLKDPKRPIGSFMFLGPTGVGKTEAAKALAEAVFDDEKALVRLDMSEYMEKHAVSKLIGAPPGYIGFEEGGQLTKTIRKKPYSVILLDEIEKAHNDVFNILLQVMDDGQLTDSKGKTVDFKNCIIIMTSNVGADKIGKNRVMGFGSQDKEATFAATKDSLMQELKNAFKPEFLNRLDETIVFHPLDRTQIQSIARLMINELTERLKKGDIQIDVTEDAIETIAKQGYDNEFGARPLKRAIQNCIEDALSDEILSGNLSTGDRILIDAKDGKLSFEKEEMFVMATNS